MAVWSLGSNNVCICTSLGTQAYLSLQCHVCQHRSPIVYIGRDQLYIYKYHQLSKLAIQPTCPCSVTYVNKGHPQYILDLINSTCPCSVTYVNIGHPWYILDVINSISISIINYLSWHESFKYMMQVIVGIHVCKWCKLTYIQEAHIFVS